MSRDPKAAAIARSKAFARKNPGTADLRKFVQSFVGKFPKELAREIKPLVRDAGLEILATAKSNSSWSRRIPRSLKLTVSLSRRSAGLSLTSNRRIAPAGRPLENLGRPGMIRHPVNPSKTVWVSQPARPWFFSSDDDIAARKIDRKIGTAVDRITRTHGFK
jgi:hypothetical protein